MKRVPLRRTRMKRRRPRPQPAHLRDDVYKAWIRKQPCCCGCGQDAPCDPAHERRQTGLALKAHDHTCIPLRRQCHRDYDGRKGKWAGWTNEQRNIWHDVKVTHHRARYLQSQSACDKRPTQPF